VEPVCPSFSLSDCDLDASVDEAPAEEGASRSYVADSGQECGLSNRAQVELLSGAMARGAAIRIRVRGLSMTPFIRDGDLLTIAPLGVLRPHPGDVVAFTYPDTERMAIHRVVARKDPGWLVRGDNCQAADGVVLAENVLGRVVRVERGTRTVRLAVGAGGRCIALLNRGNGLTVLKKAWSFLRRIAAFTLLRLQRRGSYRAIGRSLGLRIETVQAAREDLEAVSRHLDPLGSSFGLSADPGATDYVARRGAEVIGYVQLVDRSKDYAPWSGYWLFSLVVWNRYRGLGVGEALTRLVIQQAKARGAEELLLVVREDNWSAIALYDKLGFQRVVLPDLEPLLAAEKDQLGRRRVAMRHLLVSEPRTP
jgi:signal peptidase I